MLLRRKVFATVGMRRKATRAHRLLPTVGYARSALLKMTAFPRFAKTAANTSKKELREKKLPKLFVDTDMSKW